MKEPIADVDAETQSSTCIRVLIPTHGRATLLGRTLASLAECDIPEGYVETVVIENGPKSGAEAVVGDAAVDYPHLNLRYMHVERANKSHALNEALKTIGEGLVVFFDDDIRVDPGLLEAYSDAAVDTISGKYFGGPVRPEFEVTPPSWRLGTMPASVRGWVPEEPEEMKGHPFLGANWAAFKSDVLTSGRFDVKRGPGAASGSTGQETDMQRRLLERGVARRYVPDALVWHFVPKERCSVRWALRRSYRVGVEHGMNSQGAYLKGMSARRFRARAIVQAAGLVGKYGVRFDPAGVWHAVHHLWRAYGIAKGSELGVDNAVPPHATSSEAEVASSARSSILLSSETKTNT